jgi:hypothetical protein
MRLGSEDPQCMRLGSEDPHPADGYKIICDDDKKATFSQLYILWTKDSITTAPPRPQSPNLLR